MRVYFFEWDAIWRPVLEAEAEILVCKKTVWAVLPNGKRKLLGASAFLTKPSAERSHKAVLEKQTGSMEKYISKNYLQTSGSYAYAEMKKRLQTYH